MNKQTSLGLIAGVVAVLTLALMPVSGNTAVGENSLQGNIISISEDLITIASTNVESLQVSEINVQINDETQFDETASLEDLEAGDAVTIEYIEKADQKIAIHVTKVESPEFSQQMMEDSNS